MNYFTKTFKSILTLATLLFFVSCSSVQKTEIRNDKVPPINSFVKVISVLDGIPYGTGSGVIVSQVNRTNTIIMTAKHVCLDFDNKEFDIAIIDTKQKEYEAVVLYTNPEVDLCLITTFSAIPANPLPISHSKPLQGDRSLNLAAPYGIHDSDMVLMLEGFFSGKLKISLERHPLDVHTIPTAGGSSGSPIFNDKWEIIGIVSRGHQLFQNIALSVPYEFIISSWLVLEKDLPEMAALRVVKATVDKLEIKEKAL